MDIRRALVKARKAGAMVHVKRGGRGLHGISGLPLAVGESLVLLRHVWDFQIDGHVILPIASIVSLRSKDDDGFYDRVMRDRHSRATLRGRVPDVDLTDWPSFFEGFVGRKKLLIVEAEREPNSDFMIGHVLEATERRVAMSFIQSNGTWLDGRFVLPYRRITICKLDDRYSRVYARYGKRAE